MSDLNLHLSELRKSLGGKLLLRNESLPIAAGEFHLVCGNNGAGKTTLLRIVAGLEKPDRATVTIDGTTKNWRKQRKHLRHSSVYLHQFPYMLDTSVRGNLEYVLLHQKISGEEKKRLIDEAVELAQIRHIIYSHAKTLSGGEQQRVALARSLVMEPELLLLDEPFSALDAFTRASLQKDVRSIAKEIGVTLVMVTHDIDEAVIMGDRALVMAGAPGKIVHDFVIDLPDPRERQDPAVQATRSRLMQIFHDAAHSEPGMSDDKDVDTHVSATNAAGVTQ